MDTSRPGLVIKIVTFLTLASPVIGLFYTNSRENDYPRIGKRVQLSELFRKISSKDRNFSANLHELLGYIKMGNPDRIALDDDKISQETDSAPIDDLNDYTSVKFDTIGTVLPDDEGLLTKTVRRSRINPRLSNVVGRNHFATFSPFWKNSLLRTSEFKLSNDDKIKLYKVMEQDNGVAELGRDGYNYVPNLEIDAPNFG